MKRAFTLAEILITILIIGVVAALTIPPLMTAYQKHITAIHLKKAYALFQNIGRSSQGENGDFSGWDYTISTNDFANRYILPYINTYSIKYRNRLEWRNGKVFWLLRSLGGNEAIGELRGNWFYLSNGGAFRITLDPKTSVMKTARGWIYYDINGDSEPNTLGKDIFVFIITSDYDNIRLYGGFSGRFDGSMIQLDGTDTHNDIVTYLKYGTGDQRGSSCNPNSPSYTQGKTCGALIQYQGWKITKDYPW